MSPFDGSNPNSLIFLNAMLFLGIKNSASSSAVSDPVRIMSADALFPRSRLMELIMMDFPVPVSPERTVIPSLNTILRSSIIAKFLIASSRIMIPCYLHIESEIDNITVFDLVRLALEPGSSFFLGFML